jgi:sentrin-specific protease 8
MTVTTRLQSENDKRRDGTVSLGDVLLRPADIALIHAPSWLNDNLLSFFIEHAQFFFEPIMANVLLVSPSVSFLLAQSPCQSDNHAIVEMLNVGSKDWVLFAINDHTSVHAIGGTHWSLLVYVKQTGSFRHYDSSPGRRSRIASARLIRQISSSMAPGIDCTLTHVDLMPQQSNGYDCGVYVLKLMELICQWISAEGSDFDLEAHDEELQDLLTEESIACFRHHLLDLVEQYR